MRPSPFERLGGDQPPATDPSSAVRAVKGWIREVLPDAGEAALLVTELACHEPGCPPFEVVMAVLPADGPRRQRKIGKRLSELSAEDVRAAWSAGETEPAHDHE